MSEQLERATTAIDARLPWLTVRAARPGDPDLRFSWPVLLREQLAGRDPTSGWRILLETSTARQYGSAPPPAMPAAFVLQWTLEVPALIGAYAAVLGPWAADLAGLSFACAPTQHYPIAAQIRRVTTSAVASPDRLEAAAAAYRELAVPFAESYRPGVSLGRHQRRAMVDDVWAAAVARATGSQALVRRASCCFIYTLPGAQECAGCPRLTRR